VKPAPTRPPLDDRTIELALQLLLGRPALDAAEVTALRGHRSAATLRLELMRSPAFRAALPRDVTPASGTPFTLPLTLLRPPEDPALPWRFAEPDLRDPVCQLATAAQVETPDHLRWCGALRQAPRWDAAQWAQVWLLAALEKAGLLKPGLRALGLDVAEGSLACLLAGHGHQVVVTPREGLSLDALFNRDLIAAAAFAERVVPFEESTLGEFDLCWSNGSVERCGTRQAALGLIEASLAWLKPGGVALHVLSFDLSSDDAALESESLVALRRQDVLGLATRLMAQGHAIWPINLHPGTHPLDAEVDGEQGAALHLKREVAGHVLGTFGFAVRRADSPPSGVALP